MSWGGIIKEHVEDVIYHVANTWLVEASVASTLLWTNNVEASISNMVLHMCTL